MVDKTRGGGGITNPSSTTLPPGQSRHLRQFPQYSSQRPRTPREVHSLLGHLRSLRGAQEGGSNPGWSSSTLNLLLTPVSFNIHRMYKHIAPHFCMYMRKSTCKS